MNKIRSLLFYIAFLVALPTMAYGLVANRFIVGFPAVFLFCFCIYFALKKLECPSCGKSMRTISAKLSNCSFCGAEYKKRKTQNEVVSPNSDSAVAESE